MSDPWEEIKLEGEILRLKSTDCFVAELALILGGIPEKETGTILKEARKEEDDVYSHPNPGMSWLEPMCRLILKAVSDKKIASLYIYADNYCELREIFAEDELPSPELKVFLYDFLEFIVEYHPGIIDKISEELQPSIEFIKTQKNTAPKYEKMTEPFETHGMDIELWAKNIFYGISKLGIMWDGYSGETSDLIRGEAQPTGDGDCIYSHPAVPGLEQRCTTISNAIRSGKLRVKNRGEFENMIGAYFNFMCKVSLYSFVEFLVENDPNGIPISMSAIANRIESKKKSETKSEDLITKERASFEMTLDLFFESVFGELKDIASEKGALDSIRKFKAFAGIFGLPKSTFEKKQRESKGKLLDKFKEKYNLKDLEGNDLKKAIENKINELMSKKKVKKRKPRGGLR